MVFAKQLNGIYRQNQESSSLMNMYAWILGAKNRIR